MSDGNDIPNPAVRTVAQDLCFRRVLRHEQRTLESHIVKSKGDADVSIGIWICILCSIDLFSICILILILRNIYS